MLPSTDFRPPVSFAKNQNKPQIRRNHGTPSNGRQRNASGILKVLDIMMTGEVADFTGFSAPYTFYDDREYSMLLASVGLKVKRAELIPKQMMHSGREGLAGWIRTTWLPYIRRVPETVKTDFIYEIVDTYLTIEGLNANDIVSVEMVRLEFEAERK